MSNFRDRKNQAGSLILGVVVAACIGMGVIMLFVRSAGSSRELLKTHQRMLLAEASVNELLEFFLSLKSANLNTYLSENPSTGQTTAAKRYPLCAHINILNREAETPLVLNPDPVADLVKPFMPNANRWYLVQVIDIRTLEVKTSACGQVAPYDFDTNKNDRFLVTVGASWPEKDKIIRTSIAGVVLK